LKFLFEFKLQLGFSPLAQSSPPGWLNPTGSGLGRSNRPSPAPLSHPSLPRVALANPNRRRHRPTFLPASANSATTTWGKCCASASSTPSSNWIRRPLPLQGDPWLVPARVVPAPVASEPNVSLVLSWCLLCDTEVVAVHVHAGGSIHYRVLLVLPR
jgi:hypothetical protein